MIDTYRHTVVVVIMLLSLPTVSFATQTQESYKCRLHRFFNYEYDARLVYMAKFLESYFRAINKQGVLSQKKTEALLNDENLQAAFLVDSFYGLISQYNDRKPIMELLTDKTWKYYALVAFSPAYGEFDSRYDDPNYSELLLDTDDIYKRKFWYERELTVNKSWSPEKISEEVAKKYAPIEEHRKNFLQQIQKKYLENQYSKFNQFLSKTSELAFLESITSRKFENRFVDDAEVLVEIRKMVRASRIQYFYNEGNFCDYNTRYSQVLYQNIIKRNPCGDIEFTGDEVHDPFDLKNIGHWNKCKDIEEIQDFIVKQIQRIQESGDE